MKLNVPQFLQKFMKVGSKSELVGISIHAQHVRLVKVKKVGTELVYQSHLEQPYENETDLVATLTRVINAAGLEKASVSIVLPPTKYQTTQIEQEELPEVDTQAALPWKIKELINIPPQDMVCDYIDMPLQPFGQKAKVQVLAVSKSYLEQIVEPFHARNIQIDHITIESFAIAKLQKTIDAAQLIYVQRRNTDAILLILKNQEICFGRTIRSTQAIIDMSPEQIKLGGSDDIAIEIQRSIDFYESQLKQPPIKNVFLAIDGANGELLIDMLNQALPVRTKQFPIDNLAGQHDLSLGYIAALGAALYSLPRPLAEVEA